MPAGRRRGQVARAPGQFASGGVRPANGASSRLCGCAAHYQMQKVVRGRSVPAHTLPPGEGMGKPGFPIPLLEGYARPNPPAGRAVQKPGFPTG